MMNLNSSQGKHLLGRVSLVEYSNNYAPMVVMSELRE
jgi:hypothetical protein